MKPIPDITYNPQLNHRSSHYGKKKSNKNLKEILKEQKGNKKYPRDRLNDSLLALNVLKINETGNTTIKNQWISWAWWRTPIVPALGRQRQADF